MLKLHTNSPIDFWGSSIQCFQRCIFPWSICYFIAINFKYPETKSDTLEVLSLFWNTHTTHIQHYLSHVEIYLSFPEPFSDSSTCFLASSRRSATVPFLLGYRISSFSSFIFGPTQIHCNIHLPQFIKLKVQWTVKCKHLVDCNQKK